MVVHAELHGHEAGLERQHIPFEPLFHRAFHHPLLGGLIRRKKLGFIRVRPLAQPGGIPSPTHIAEGQVPGGMPGQSIGLDIGGVEPLLGDAIPEKHNPLPIMNGELPRMPPCDEGQKKKHHRRFCLCQRFHGSDAKSRTKPKQAAFVNRTAPLQGAGDHRAARRAFFNTGSIPSAIRMKPRSVGCTPSTVPWPSSPRSPLAGT